MTDRLPAIRIFISSPGDVAEERDGARRVISGLQRFYPNVRLEPVLWEELALPATASFQQTIDYLLDREPIDIAVFILWSRLGSPLGTSITRPDGTPYRSGTEREFDLMLHAFEQSEGKRPVILAYVREDKDGVLEKFEECDDSQWEDLIVQRRLVKSFIREQFQDAEGRNIRAYQSYSEPVGFLDQLKLHLRRTLNDMLDVEASATWTEEPYRGLEVFDIDHAPIFHGRDEPTYQLLQILRDRRRDGCEFVVIVGPSGSGKSSLARAGVAANLVQQGANQHDARWQVLTFTPTLTGQSEDRALTRSLVRMLGELIDIDSTVDEISQGLAENGDLTVRLTISPAFKRLKQPIRLLLVLDQMEELWTDSNISQEAREHFLKALAALASSGHVAVLATLRSDFYHHAQASPTFLELKGTSGHYDLLAPDAASIHHLIVEPARLSGLRFEQHEHSGRTLDELILEDTGRHSDALPLLEYLLWELYRRRDVERNLLTFAAYEELGGVEGAIGRRAAETFESLPREAQQALEEILPLLISVDTSMELAAVRRRAEVARLTSTSARKRLVEELIQARFLSTDRQQDVPVAGFAHEALLRSWDPIVHWIQANREQLALRARVEQSQQRWEQQGRDASLLLADGLPLDEGQQLLRDSQHLLNASTKDYIEISIAEQDRKQRQSRRVRVAVQSTISILLVAIVATAVTMHLQNTREKRIAETEARVASLMTARPDAVPAEIELLIPLKDYALKYLPAIASDAEEDTQHQFRAMCALAHFDSLTSPQVEFLVELVPISKAGDSANLVRALSADEDLARKLLRTRFEAESDDLRRVRWAIALLSLGAPEAAQEMLALNSRQVQPWGADPASRTVFIQHFRDWPGDRSVLPSVLDRHQDSASFCSGLCAALGKVSVDSFHEDTLRELEGRMNEFYLHARHASVKNAAEFALKQWRPTAELSQGNVKPPNDANWFVNDLGMTMVRLNAGKFKMGSDVPGHPRNEQPLDELVEVEAFYLCDREVSQAQFHEFLEWKSRQDGEAPPTRESTYEAQYPFFEAGFLTATAFCDYLNERLGRSESTGLYRLPTEAEWEYACRANTHTDYCCGDHTHLEQYAVFQRGTPAVIASKLPNAWGFFDMHGNVHEWCSSQYRDTYHDTTLQPERVHRGGWWALESFDIRSARREASNIDNDYEDGFGIRVALDNR